MEPSSFDPLTPPKKKRGRPRKSDPIAENSQDVTMDGSASKPKPRVSAEKAAKRGIKEGEGVRMKDAKQMVGQSVDGVIDGAFDAGYLVTIRIGSDAGRLYHGVVFGPDLSIPINREIDVAPELTMVNYNAQKQQILAMETPVTPDY